ncbi:MAG TPA: cation:proton antiporter [Thermodesulfobacteriota bacterium]|nr:cation:proton antiporter [Thermodesulfobacteriota bacterium]
MEQIPLLQDIVILTVISVPMSIILTRAGLPTVIGFLITGVIIGPHGLGLVTEVHTVEILAEIGVVMLLFTIGLEFSITKMLGIRREGILGGGLQVGLTTGIVLFLSLVLGQPLKVALLLGFVISLSSTAIVLKLLIDKGEVNTPRGNFSVGVLLFQDIAVVLMFMVVQSLGGEGRMGSGASALDMARGLGISIAAFVGIVFGVGYIIPRIFEHVVRLRNREVFILTILFVCLGTAWVSSMFGLSLAMGAFIAGLAISESEYSSQIVAEVIPFRDTFSSLFFISIGMLLNFQFFIHNFQWIILLVVAIMFLKSLTIVGVGRALGYPLMLSVAVGLNLAQIGEFSFILIKMGQGYGLLDEGLYQSLLAASILTMAATPFVYQWSPRAAYEAGHFLGKRTVREPRKPAHYNHVIIIGYGINGRNLARVLKETGINHAIVDINMQRVRNAKKEGYAAFFGDASHPEILKHMGVEKAKMLVVAITDPITTRRVVRLARELNPAISIVVRTRYLREVEELYKLGANQVIPEEFETSVEIFARVLRDYRIPTNIIQNQIDLVRQEGYAMLRTPSTATTTAERLTSLTNILELSLMDTYYVEEGCSVAGRTIAQINLRKLTGTTIIAVVRKGTARTNPPADFLIDPGDIFVLLGSHAELNSAMELLKESCPV